MIETLSRQNYAEVEARKMLLPAEISLRRGVRG
jgi:hypothetical protein